jgi:uncharacterized protein DUF3105
MKKQRQLQREQARIQQARRRWLMYIGGGLVVALGVITLGLFLLQPRTAQGGSTVASANCSDIHTVADQGRTHLNPGQSYDYGGSNPPSSGPHDPEPMPPGIYDNPIPETREVHSLEHGYIIIHYNAIPADAVQQLASIAQQDRRKIIVAPFPSMSYKISLTAWDHLQTCDGVDEQVIKSFIAEFRDQGPEQTPM